MGRIARPLEALQGVPPLVAPSVPWLLCGHISLISALFLHGLCVSLLLWVCLLRTRVTGFRAYRSNPG